MGVYFLLLIWSLLSTIIFKFKIKGKNKSRKIIYLLMNFIPMILVSGFREKSVGTDTMMYNQLFKHFTTSKFNINNSVNFDVEWGYIFLNKIAGFFSDDSQSIIFFMSFLTLTGFAYFLYKNSVCVWQSTFIFIGMFFLEPMNSIRQSFSVMVICCGYIYLVKREIIKYFFCILISSLFHRSTLFFLVFLPLFFFKCKKYHWIYIGFISGIVLLYLNDPWVILQFDFFDKYISYINSEYIYPKEIGMGIYKIMVFLVLVFMGIIFNERKKFNSIEKRNIYISSIYILCACLATIGQYKIGILYRFVFCFSIYICILIPLVLSKFKLTKKMFVLLMILTIPFYLYYMLSINSDFLY